MNRVLHSIPLLYAVLLWPGRETVLDLYFQEWYYPQMMFESGVWAIQLLILTMAVTPTLKAINRIGYGKAFGRWLLPRRRHFGLVSALFALVHLLHYVINTADLGDVVIDMRYLSFLTGWIAFGVMVALSITSNNAAMRLLGPWWKRLHLLMYPAIALILWHWYLFDFQFDRVAFWGALLCIPKVVQLGLTKTKTRKVSAIR